MTFLLAMIVHNIKELLYRYCIGIHTVLTAMRLGSEDADSADP